MKQLLFIFCALISLNIYSQDTINNTLEEVVVNGVRASKKAPISEKTLNLNDIKKTNVSFEPSNILSKTPNVTMSTDNGTPFGYTYFRIRGIDQTRINMTLNGVPLNEPEDQGVFFSNIPSFMENISSLQVQRGVGTSSNGVSSFGGSINFQTANHTDKGITMKYDIGSFNTARFTSTYSSGLKNNFALNVSGSSYRTDGYRYGSGGRGNMLYLNAGYFKEKNSLKLTSIFGTSRNGMAWMAVSEDDINNNPRTNYNKDDAWDNFKQSLTMLEYKHKLPFNTTFTSSIFYNKLVGEYDYMSIFSTSSSRNLGVNSDFYGVISNINYKGDRLTIDYGINANSYYRKHNYFNDFNQYSTDFGGPLPKPSSNTGHKNEMGVYVKGNYKLNRFTIFTDLHYRDVSFDYTGDVRFATKQWNFFNPKGGITYTYGKTIFYYSVGLSHREPTRTNLFNGSDYLDSTLGVNSINYESVVDHEVGIKHFCDALSFQGNFFYMDFKNEFMPLGVILPNGTPQVISVNNSVKKGIELDLTAKFGERFRGSLNQTMMISKIYDTGTEAPLAPNTVGNYSFGYDYKGLAINILTRMQGQSYLDVENYYEIPSFTTLDSNISYTTGKYFGMLTIGNITNQKYYTNGSVIGGVRQLYVNSPLNLFLTLKYTL